LLSNDLLGFHIRYNCNNFMDTIDRSLEARVDRDRYEISYNNHKTVVNPFPISVDFEEINRDAQKEEVVIEIERMRKKLGLRNEIIGIGIERFDYTKGIPDRFKAIDRFLEKYPQNEKNHIHSSRGDESDSY
jgi:trehalose-6-phosphate synthase